MAQSRVFGRETDGVLLLSRVKGGKHRSPTIERKMLTTRANIALDMDVLYPELAVKPTV